MVILILGLSLLYERYNEWCCTKQHHAVLQVHRHQKKPLARRRFEQLHTPRPPVALVVMSKCLRKGSSTTP